MLATPLSGLKVFARDAIFRSGHMVDLHTLTYLYLAKRTKDMCQK
jgi:hypothetical protein